MKNRFALIFAALALVLALSSCRTHLEGSIDDAHFLMDSRSYQPGNQKLEIEFGPQGEKRITYETDKDPIYGFLAGATGLAIGLLLAP